MDTSIAFLLLAAVLFVVIVPTVLKRSAERDEEVLPDRLRTVDVERAPRCATDDSRPQLLHDASHPALIDLPTPVVETVPTAPRLSLRTSRPALEVVAGSRTSGPQSDAPPGWDEEDVEAEALPMAAGHTAPLDLRSAHLTAVRSASGTADVLAFAPARATLVASAGSADPETMDPAMTSSHRTAHRRVADAAERMPTALPADVRARLAQSSAGGAGRGPASSAGRSRPHAHHGSTAGDRRRPAPARPTMDAASRKRIRTLRAVLPFCGLAVVGLALLTLVFAGFVVFGSMPWGVPVVTAALAAASLGLVRGLNKEIRALRAGSAPEAAARSAAPHPSRSTGRPGARTSAAQTSAARTPAARTSAAARAHTAGVREAGSPHPGAQPAHAQSPAARASRQVVDIEEPITADLPVVREESAATDDAIGIEPTNRTDKDDSSDETATSDADSVSHEGAASDAASTSDEVTASDTGPVRDTVAADEGSTSTANTASTRTRSIFAASAQSDGPSVAESLARRRAPGEWTPSVLPTPRYVDAPLAEREAPEPVAAEASSYSLTPASRESLAEQFAEELGYRPALTDAAREHSEQAAAPVREKATGSDGPLSHGRTAITGSGNAQTRSGRHGTEGAPAQLGDILARRRA